jgi:hypothetical protein
LEYQLENQTQTRTANSIQTKKKLSLSRRKNLIFIQSKANRSVHNFKSNENKKPQNSAGLKDLVIDIVY